MIFLPFAHFFSVIVCLSLTVYIFYKNPRSLLNRVYSIIMLSYALWNFGDIVAHNPDRSITKETVVIMQNIASIGWASFASGILYFSLVFSKKEKLIRKKWFLFFVLTFPLLFIYMQFTNHLTQNPVRQPYGWSFYWADSIWTYLFFAYNIISILFSILIIYLYGRKTKSENERRQSNILVITYSFGILAGSLSDVLLQQLNIYIIPPLANLLVVVIACGVIYAIFKYRFFIITPTVAAENIISVMDESLILLNQEGSILTINKATADSLQYEQKDLEGKSVTMLFHEESFGKELLERITNEEVISNQEGRFQGKNKKKIPIIYSSSPVKDNVGAVIGTVFIARDISLLKQIQDELIKSKEKAEESDRLKTAFLANMSHEIRTPMNGILGFADLLKEPNLTGEQQQEYIRIIEQAGARMLNIINEIIDISKIEANLISVNLEEYNIDKQIEFICTFFKPEADAKGLQLFFNNTLPGKEINIETDREKVFAILANLIKNAIKYSEKGSIEIGYNIIDNPQTAYIQFFVKDTGIGIPKEKQEAIFKRFIKADITEKMARQGAGLGLSITKAYVEMLGGEIWVESEEGTGSTFYFTLPYNTRLKEKINFEDKVTSIMASDNVKRIKY